MKKTNANKQVCSRCVMDSTVPGIHFDEYGVCTFCHIHDELEKKYPLGMEGKQRFEEIIDKVKRKGIGKKYDCVVGVSGGRDSTFTLYTAIKHGLRPLAVHFDNGWNAEIGDINMKAITDKFHVDLITYTADPEEFKDIQLAFLKASVSDAESPTDFMIHSVLYDAAIKHGVSYIFNGHSFRTEGVAPIGWSYMDGRYIKSIQKQFGKLKTTKIPIMTLTTLVWNTFVRRIKVIDVPEFVEYKHEDVDEVLRNEVGWEYYGAHHHESIYTIFVMDYYLPKKFNIDKRKVEYSALIRSGQITRDQALNMLSEPITCESDIIEDTKKRLGLSDKDFEDLMNAPLKTFRDYKTYYPLIKLCKYPIKFVCALGLLPQVFYEKFLG